MFTVALIAQKGGVGKTTLAVTLAVLAALEDEGSGIIDADPSRNATKWGERRRKHQQLDKPLIVAASEPDTLQAAVRAARSDGLEWLFIDTGAGVAEQPAIAAAMADLLLIPCVPSGNSMEGMAPTAKLARRIKKPAFFIVNKGRNSRALNDQAAVALTSAFGLPAVSTHVQMRWPIADAELLGLALPEIGSREASSAKGIEEFKLLWQWLKQQRDGADSHGE